MPMKTEEQRRTSIRMADVDLHPVAGCGIKRDFGMNLGIPLQATGHCSVWAHSLMPENQQVFGASTRSQNTITHVWRSPYLEKDKATVR